MMIKNILFLFSIFFCFLFTYSVFAENKSNKLKTELKVEADESLEWFEKEKYYLAKGNVILTKDGLILNASKVRANYQEENGENVLKMIIANGDVILIKGNVKATGEFMRYNVKGKIALITGKFQTFTSPSGYIESNKKLVFNDNTNKAEAIGKVKIILKNKTKIFADRIKADFTGKAKSLHKAFARGNVIIQNYIDGKKSQADIGIYDSKTEIIELKGNVKINNQGSIIMGSEGINNIKTGISKITGNKKQRVKGTFSPKKKIKKGEGK
jgi:lipopolysaccharide transport protein LptA